MSPATPTVRAAFQRVNAGLRAHHASLRPGADANELTQAQTEVCRPLPEGVRAYFETHDGAQDGTELLLYGGRLCSVAEMVQEWRAITDLQHDGTFDGFEIDAEPDPGIRSDLWWRDGWLPLVARDGDYLVLDLDPAPDGTLGQVFAWSRLDGAGMLAAPSLAAWLESWADELASAKPPKSVDELVHRPGSPVWPIRD